MARPTPENPFITCVMPVAYEDELVMSAVLCLGGTHLLSTANAAMVSEIQRVTLIQYGLVLQGLRRILLEPDSSRVNRRMTIRILVTVMLLCEIEVC